MGAFRECSQHPCMGSNLHFLDRSTYKYSLKSDLSIYEIIQILSISSMDKASIKELLTEEFSNQNVKEQINFLTSKY